jgi:hypothetical protein
MIKITVIFQVALFPEKKICITSQNTYASQDTTSLKFDKYICKDSQSNKVLSLLKRTCNFDIRTDMYLRNIKYELNGHFTAEMILIDDDEEGYEDQDKELLIALAYENLYPGEKNEYSFITIKEKTYALEIKIIDIKL